jgi:hypothetical protein
LELVSKNKDNLANLRASIHYYEHVADPGNDMQRKAALDNMTLKLKKVLTRTESELAGKLEHYQSPHKVSLISLAIDKEISDLKAQSSTLFDDSDFQKYRVSQINPSLALCSLSHPSMT